VRVFADMRAPDPFAGPLQWLAAAAGQQVPMARVDERFGLDLLLFRAGSPAAERLLSDPAGPFAPVSVDARFVLFARAAAARERGLVVPYPRGIDAPAPPDALRAQSERMLRTWPDNAFANETLARLDLQEGRPADAARRAAAMAKPYPRDATWPWVIGRARADQNDLAGAEAALHEARRWSPESARVALDLARVQLARGRFEAGISVLEAEARRRAYRLSGEEFVLLGALREGAGRKEGAADAYTRALWIGGAGVDAERIRSRLAALPRSAVIIQPTADPPP
jgi:tetratricopeptide (TPR) repeat protein